MEKESSELSSFVDSCEEDGKTPWEKRMEGPELERIRSYLEGKKDEMLSLLERLVNIDSGSYCKSGIDACGQMVGKEIQKLGFEFEVIREAHRGNHLKAIRSGVGVKRLLILVHMDTVWPVGSAANFPFRVEDDFAYGPGVGDMKTGIVQMIYALKALQEFSLDTPSISIFLTGDEELGSIKGRPYIEEETGQSAWVLVMESPPSPDVIVVQRWGGGAFYLRIQGKAAHVLDGVAAGVNACRELALKVLSLESLSDPLRGIKVSVNLLQGGLSRQMTAPEARADIDVRVRELAFTETVEKNVRMVASTPFLPGIQLELTGGMTRPPMEMNSDTEKLLSLAIEVGRKIGMDLRSGSKPGGSDGNFSAARQVATLDGLGPTCLGLYTTTERIKVEDIVSRALLTVGIIHRLSQIA